MNPDAEAAGFRHEARMGKRKSGINVYVRDLLYRILQERKITQAVMAAELGISIHTLKGLLKVSPRPASQDVQAAIQREYQTDPRGPAPPPVVGVDELGLVTLTKRTDMAAEILLKSPISELKLRAGDWIRIEPHTGPMIVGGWYLVSFGRTTDALVQAVLIKGAMHFRQADAPADDARVFLPESHRVSFAVLAGVRSLVP